jgi:hypothetical protein
LTSAPAHPATLSRAATRAASAPSHRRQFQTHTHFPSNIIACIMPVRLAISKGRMALKNRNRERRNQERGE